ncbi:DUF7674 family protein [Saccharothrix variisporea]|uniref:DUF7674 domain-containing protein n=1 Tax=Saccharothrix variisporea TaxID=543527 RepID=A0A495XBR7_9PSEU|nr:hypothetical protein [Saccharothrix variisporea]RKT71462.1 hypothetical protein DFJ66_4751 [Saccharothrix variisporea]
MVDWRTRASALLPELGAVIERESWSCHVFLSELWQLALEAHRDDDRDTLTRVYGFAHWCFQQEQFLSNASVVSFYEHVFDEWELRHLVAPWLPGEVVDKVRPLWEWRWPAERLAEVDRLLEEVRPPGRNAV